MPVTMRSPAIAPTPLRSISVPRGDDAHPQHAALFPFAVVHQYRQLSLAAHRRSCNNHVLPLLVLRMIEPYPLPGEFEFCGNPIIPFCGHAGVELLLAEFLEIHRAWPGNAIGVNVGNTIRTAQ